MQLNNKQRRKYIYKIYKTQDTRHFLHKVDWSKTNQNREIEKPNQFGEIKEVPSTLLNRKNID